MGTVSLDQLANPANLRACIDATASMTGNSASMVREAMADVLERQLCVRSDDMEAVWRVGRLLQVVRVEAHSAPHGGKRSR